ncbi:hypothetical protein GCM10027343_19840 [Noviherbaspirillum agri]
MSQQINLFNPIFLKQKKYFSAVTMAQALGLILLGCLAMGSFASYRVAGLAEDAKATNMQLALVQEQLNQVKASYGPRQKDQTLEEEVQRTEAEIHALRQVTDDLKNAELSKTRSYAEHMRAFSRRIVSGVWLTGFTINDTGTSIGLEGRALRPDLVPIYINRLKQEPVLQGKSFATLEMQAVQPPVEHATDKGAASAGGTAVGVPFIEFSLQSSSTSTQADLSGAKSK